MARARPRARKRALALSLALGASLLLVLFVAGLAFSNSIGAAQVADNARSLHWANATLGTSSLTRAALVQAVTFAGLEEEGLVSDGDLAYALGQLEGSHAELAQLERGGVGRSSLPP